MKVPAVLACIALTGFVATAVRSAPEDLPALGADPAQTSVSGLSSGAFMAVQLQVAYSRRIVGAGVIAGGPYYCAANNQFFVGICMGQFPFAPLNPALMARFAQDFAAAGTIDPLRQLRTRRVYVFGGTEDSVVRPGAVAAAASFFRQVGVVGQRLKVVDTVPAGHAVITPAFGNDCAANDTPFISHCTVGGVAYDQAGELLKHIYRVLAPRAATPAGRMLAFDQRAYAVQQDTGMSDTAYLYVPDSCKVVGARCKVHVALHGCLQSVASVGERFVTDAGYNRWADSNRLLVLYPQVDKSDIPQNPQGCWDWWGFTGGDYAKQAGPQMKAIIAMVGRLTQRP